MAWLYGPETKKNPHTHTHTHAGERVSWFIAGGRRHPPRLDRRHTLSREPTKSYMFTGRAIPVLASDRAAHTRDGPDKQHQVPVPEHGPHVSNFMINYNII